MKRKKTLSKLKKDLDTVFSQYIRLKYADKEGMVQCYTCTQKRHWKDGMQNGHFVPRQYLRTRYDERNCRPQCYACNQLYNGQPSAFAANLKKEYGEGIVEELEKNRMNPLKLDHDWYEENIKTYKEEVKALQG